MQERTTSAGLAVVEHRSLRPPSTPNDTVPPESDPGTVGPPDARPGDPDGVEFVAGGPGGPWPPSISRPAAWSGWPGEWNTPWWSGRIEELADTAWACLDLNGSLLSTMPPYLVDAASSLSAEWMINPDPDFYTSWEEFAKQLFWEFQLGEVFVLATAYYATGWPARFHVAPPWTVNVELDGAGRRRYSIGGLDVTGDVLHIRYKSSVDDAHGHGPLEAGRGRLVAARVLSRYGTDLAAAGGVPPSVLEHPDELTAMQSAELQHQWVAARMAGMGLPAVLSGGVTWKATQVNPKDLGLVDLLEWNEARIAVLLGVPPFLMGLPAGGDSMTYSNVISLFDYHWRAGLRPKAATVMAALSVWALPRGTTAEVNRDEYVKPGPLERAQTWEILIGLGVLSVEQVAEIERYNNSAPSETLSAGVLQ